MTTREILAAVKGKRVLVVGDVMLDEHVWCERKREGVLAVKGRTFAPGAAAHVAVNCQTIGGESKIAGVIGQDANGDIFEDVATGEDFWLDTELVHSEKHRPTTTKTRIMLDGKCLERLDVESTGPIGGAWEDSYARNLDAKDFDACVVSDFGKGMVTDFLCRWLVGECLRLGVPCVCDPKGKDADKYRGCTVLKPNLDEFRDLVPSGDWYKGVTGHRFVDEFGSSLLVTCGGKGMVLFESGKVEERIPAGPFECVDFVGAGDVASAALALALAAKVPLLDAAKFANLAAGVSVTKLGTVPVKAEELEELAREEVHADREMRGDQ